MDFPIVVLFSGRGSNLASLANHARSYRILAAVTNNPEAAGIKVAAELGIETIVVPRSGFPAVAPQKKEIFRRVEQLNPRLVALAGYMQKVEPYFVDAFFGRIVNIHPSLLPKFPGLDTHRRALESRESKHGCSVHFVDADFDTGPIIAQAAVPVVSDDTETSLAARVLAGEHRLYPWVLNSIARGEISFNQNHVSFSAGARLEANQHSFQLPP